MKIGKRIALFILNHIPLPAWLQVKLFIYIVSKETILEENEQNFIRPNAFATINTNEFIDQGFPKDHVVFVAAAKAVPVEEGDPYLQRVYVFVNTTKNFSVDTEKLYLMDPRQLDPLDEETSKIYFNQLEIDFGDGNATTD